MACVGMQKWVLSSGLLNHSSANVLKALGQLRNFFKLCNVEGNKIEERINYICSKTNIEFFSKSDLRQYVEKIKTSMDEFFLC